MSTSQISPIEQSNQRLPSLDGVRAISVMMVLLGHGYATIDQSHSLTRSVVKALGNAHLGVTIFFVVSGYLITYLLRQELTRAGKIDLPGFYFRRVTRIFPIFYLYLGVLGVLVAFGHLAVHGAEIGTAATFSWNYGHLWRPPPSPDIWYLGHFWTLALEEQFYLFWPVALLLLGARRGAALALIIIPLMPVMRVVSYFLFPGSRGQLGMMLHTGLDSLMFGCLWSLWEGAPAFERVVERLNRPLVPAAACVWLFLGARLAENQIRGFDVVIGNTLNCAAIAITLLWLVRNAGSVVGRFLNWKPIARIGVISYGLYVWQQLFLTPIAGHQLAPFPLNIVLSFAVAELSFRLVEQPLILWRRRKSAQGRPDGALRVGEVIPGSMPPCE